MLGDILVSKLLKAQLPLPLLPFYTLSLMPLALVTYRTRRGGYHRKEGQREGAWHKASPGKVARNPGKVARNPGPISRGCTDEVRSPGWALDVGETATEHTVPTREVSIRKRAGWEGTRPLILLHIYDTTDLEAECMRTKERVSYGSITSHGTGSTPIMLSESKPGWIPKAAVSTYDGKDFVFSPGSTNGSGVSGEVLTRCLRFRFLPGTT